MSGLGGYIAGVVLTAFLGGWLFGDEESLVIAGAALTWPVTVPLLTVAWALILLAELGARLRGP